MHPEPNRRDPAGMMNPFATDTLTPLFCPRSVAIVGASDDPTRISGRALRYLIDGGFQGEIFPVNPTRPAVQGLQAYASIAELQQVPDVAIIAVSSRLTGAAVRECAGKGVKAVVLFSAGYAETGDEGAGAQDEILTAARATGMRVLGPNCLGLFNSALGFYGTFSGTLEHGMPFPGPISVVSQSGAYGAHLAYLLRERRLGVRYCVTTGNEADVDLGQSLLWLARQPDVGIIVAHAEGIRDGATFVEALRVAHDNRKPVIFMKVGGSAAGSRAASSHTAALAGADAVYDSVFQQYGVHRARSIDEQLDVAYACARGVLPRGNRLGVITVSGGGGIHICDAAERQALDVAPMPDTTQRRLKAMLPYAAVANPVDATAQAVNDMSVLERYLEAMLEEGGYDSLIGFFTTVAGAAPFAQPLRQTILRATRGYGDRLIVLCMLADAEIVRAYEDSGFLVFQDVDRAVAAIAALTRLSQVFRQELVPRPAAEVGTAPLPREPLSEYQAKRLLAAAGIPMLPERLVASAQESAAAGDALGYPVAMKIVSPDIVHKTEIGGVLLDVQDAAAARNGFETLWQRATKAAPGARIDGVLVTPMAGKGVETIIGVQSDPTFGPMVMFGLGGIFVEVFKDVTLRLAPFDQDEALRMIGEVKGHALLEGVRGAPRCDIPALARTLVAVSRFAAAHTNQLESIDINPFLVLPEGQGAVALDALIVNRVEKR